MVSRKLYRYHGNVAPRELTTRLFPHGQPPILTRNNEKTKWWVIAGEDTDAYREDTRFLSFQAFLLLPPKSPILGTVGSIVGLRTAFCQGSGISESFRSHAIRRHLTWTDTLYIYRRMISISCQWPRRLVRSNAHACAIYCPCLAELRMIVHSLAEHHTPYPCRKYSCYITFS
jgi:hypothetical protein